MLAVFGNGLWAILALFFLAALYSIPFRNAAGQRFAEGFFFEGALFLLLSGIWVVPRDKDVGKNKRRAKAKTIFLIISALSLAALGIYSLYIEPWMITVKRYEIASEKIDVPVRIVFIADIQTDTIGPHERRGLELVKMQKPDLILFGGDYLQFPKGLEEEGIAALNRLLKEMDFDPPLGMFAVEGNHDIGLKVWERIFEGTGIVIVKSSRTVFLEKSGNEIALTMLDFDASMRSNPKNSLSEEKRNGFHVMLGHAPAFALGETDADLLLAGHTHGGQVQIPGLGPVITLSPNLPRRYGSGLSELPGGSKLIVSNGLGMERGRAPRIRFNAPPQIVVIDLVPLSH